MLLLCSHSHNDVPPEHQRNVSMAMVPGAMHPLMNDTPRVNPPYIVQSLSLNADLQLQKHVMLLWPAHKLYLSGDKTVFFL